jgi:hypothetical protein
MYLNIIVGRLQILEGALHFIRHQRKAKVLSTNAVEPMTRAFVQAIEQFVKDHQIPLITFEKGQRKDELAAQLRAQFAKREGVVFVGKSARKVHRLSHRETAQPEEEHQLCVDRQIHRPRLPLGAGKAAAQTVPCGEQMANPPADAIPGAITHDNQTEGYYIVSGGGTAFIDGHVVNGRHSHQSRRRTERSGLRRLGGWLTQSRVERR